MQLSIEWNQVPLVCNLNLLSTSNNYNDRLSYKLQDQIVYGYGTFVFILLTALNDRRKLVGHSLYLIIKY